MTNKKSYSSVSQIIFTVLFTASSIGINYLGSFLAGLIAFPLYLDSVMTIAVTALCGLIPGLICAVASNLLLYIFANTGIIFMPCHISTAVIAYFVFRAERKNHPKEKLLSSSSFMWAGFFAALSNSILGDTMSAFFYKANTSIPQVDNAVQGIYVVIRNLNVAAYIGGTLTNLVDKIISAAICYAVYRLILRITKNTFKLNLLPL